VTHAKRVILNRGVKRTKGRGIRQSGIEGVRAAGEVIESRLETSKNTENPGHSGRAGVIGQGGVHKWRGLAQWGSRNCLNSDNQGEKSLPGHCLGIIARRRGKEQWQQPYTFFKSHQLKGGGQK